MHPDRCSAWRPVRPVLPVPLAEDPTASHLKFRHCSKRKSCRTKDLRVTQLKSKVSPDRGVLSPDQTARPESANGHRHLARLPNAERGAFGLPPAVKFQAAQRSVRWIWNLPPRPPL